MPTNRPWMQRMSESFHRFLRWFVDVEPTRLGASDLEAWHAFGIERRRDPRGDTRIGRRAADRLRSR